MKMNQNKSLCIDWGRKRNKQEKGDSSWASIDVNLWQQLIFCNCSDYTINRFHNDNFKSEGKLNMDQRFDEM
jgi:hypothetical protein